MSSPFGRPIRISPLGEGALTIDIADHVDVEVSAVVSSIARRLDRAALAGVVEIQPALAAILITYDPTRLSDAEVAELARSATAAEPSCFAPREVAIPVCFDAAMAFDLPGLGENAGLTPLEVIDLFTASDYVVHAIGFLPGYAYMGSVPESLRRPRRATPRIHVPAGSVAVAGSLAAVYPCPSPGGWHVIGATPLVLFDVRHQPPSLLQPGDRVRFEQITASQYERLVGERTSTLTASTR